MGKKVMVGFLVVGVVTISRLAKKSMWVFMGLFMFAVVLGAAFYDEVRDIAADIILTDKEFSDCKATADGKQFCDGRVYECDGLVDNQGLKECMNAVDLGEPVVDNFFGGHHLADGNHFTFAEHSVNPKNFLGVGYDAFLTYEVIVKKGDGVKSFVVEKKVPYNFSLFGTKESCVDEGVNGTVCYSEVDESNITGYVEKFRWESDAGNDSRILLDENAVEYRTRFYLKKNVFKQAYLIDVIPIIEVVKKDLSERLEFKQVEWEDISPTSDILVAYWAYDNVLTDSAGGDNQGGSQDWVANNGANYVTDVCKSGSCLLVNNSDSSYWFSFEDTNSDMRNALAGDFTINYWQWIDVGIPDGSLIKMLSTGDGGDRQFYNCGAQKDTDRYVCNIEDGVLVNGNSSIIYDQWAYVSLAVSDTGNTYEWYLNGVPAGSGSAGEVSLTAEPTIELFNHWETPNILWLYDGYLDEYTIFNETLPQSDIISLYENNGVPPVGNTAPSCTVSNTNITVPEDSGVWYLDANMSEAVNISCSDADGDALAYTCTGTGYTNPNNDDLIFTTVANATGTYLGNCEVSDGTDTTEVDFQAVVSAVNDAPWWDEIGNNTKILNSNTPEPTNINASQYWRDAEQDRTPDNITITLNETLPNCYMDTASNFSIFCNPNYFNGSFIIILNGTDNEYESAITSFKIKTNTAPSIPTIISPENNALNDTIILNLSCSGSEDINGDIIFYDYVNTTSAGTFTNYICLNAGEECLWNNTEMPNQIVYWTCNANDTFLSSNSIDVRGINTQTWDVIDVNQSNPATAEEGELITIETNISWNEIRYNNIIAKLNYSGTIYDPTKTQYDNYTNFIISLTTPSETTDTDQYFNWTYNLTYQNSSIFQNDSYGGSVNVSAIYAIENCTGNSTDAVAVNFSFWQENTLQEFDFNENDSGVDIDATFIVYKDTIAANDTKTYSQNNQTYFTLCIPEGKEYKSITQIVYIKPLFDKRQYYFINQTLNNQTQNISLYLLEIALGSGITFNIKDSQGNNVEDAYIYAYRQDTGTDTEHLVSMGLSDADGKDYLYMRKFDAFYKFEVRKDGIIRYQDTTQRKINDDTITLRFGTDTISDLIDVFDSISYTLTNTSSNIVLTYSDSGSSATQYCLTVYKQNSSDAGYVCETCSASRTDTITCPFDNDGNYIANAWASVNPDRPFATFFIDALADLVQGFGKTGLFGAFLTILTLGCVGLAIGRVYGVVIGTLIGIFLSSMLGMLALDYGTMIGFVILGIIFIIYAKD